MPRRNRVDPWGDLHAVPARGLFTGNRGCLVDDHENVVRHHGSQLWITCVTKFRDWRWPLARGRRWTPIFFLDEAVALAAGHRPCGFCRRDAYRAYRDAVGASRGATEPLLARDLNALLAAERLPKRGRGLERAQDRIVWTARCADVPDGAVVADHDGRTRLVRNDRLYRFTFDGWTDPIRIDRDAPVRVLTPRTSVGALAHGYAPVLHPTAG